MSFNSITTTQSAAFTVSGHALLPTATAVAPVTAMPDQTTTFSKTATPTQPAKVATVVPGTRRGEGPAARMEQVRGGVVAALDSLTETTTITYSYDPLYRLTGASYTGSLTNTFGYTYDAVGNRLTQNASGTVISSTYDIANRLTNVNGQAYTWDDNGNLLNDGMQTYTYDQANRLKTAVQGGTTYSFGYNGVGDRLSQTVRATATHYVLDPGAGLTQVLADGTNTYLYGNDRLAQYQAGMQYFGPDALASVRQIYDASGQVVGNSRYDPYGNVMSQSGATSVYGFTGEWTDATGLVHLRARYYSSAQGRFVTRDTWEGDPNAPMSYNAWLYAYANAVNLMDPSGQQPVSSQVLLSLVSGVIPGLNISFGTNLSRFLADLLDACVLEHMPPGIGPVIPNGQSSSGSNAGAPPPAMPIPPPRGAPSITKAGLADLARAADIDSLVPLPISTGYAVTSIVGGFLAVGEGNVYCPLERVKESDPAPASCGTAFKALLLTVRNRYDANEAAAQVKRSYPYLALDNINTYARIMTRGCDQGRCSQYEGLNSWEDKPQQFNLLLPKIERQFRIAVESALEVFNRKYSDSNVGKHTYFALRSAAPSYCRQATPVPASECYSSSFGAAGPQPTSFWGQ